MRRLRLESEGHGRLRFALAAVLMCAGCGLVTGSKSPDQVVGSYADHLGRIADQLDKVQSAADADSAAAAIGELIKQSDTLARQASGINAAQKQQLSPEVEARLSEQAERVRTGIARLRTAGLLTPQLSAALQQAQAAQDTFLAYGKAGGLPDPETPLDRACVELIQVNERIADALAAIHDVSSAQVQLPTLQALRDEEYAALVRLAELGAESPPSGIPDKYRTHYKAARKRREQHDINVGDAARQAIVQVLAPLHQDHQRRPDPFRLDAALRRAGSAATVTLVNNKSLAGPRHQRMMQMLQEQAGAQHMQSVIDDDGTYRVVLAPVADFSSFARTVNLGTVSAVDAQARTFTLTIDPARVPDVADPAVPAFGAPPGTGPGFLPGNPGPGSSARPPASDRVVYATITWQRYSGPKPGDGARTVVTQLAAYVPDSLSVDETAMSMTFQHRGPLDAAAVSHMLAASGFGRTIVRTSTNPPRSDP